IIENENYMPLSYVFDQIDQNYKYKILHKPLMICEYQQDGMTKNKRKLIRNNPKGYTLYKKQFIKLAPDFKNRFKASANYVTGCILSKNQSWLNDSPNKFLTLLSIPIGFADYIIRYAFIDW